MARIKVLDKDFLNPVDISGITEADRQEIINSDNTFTMTGLLDDPVIFNIADDDILEVDDDYFDIARYYRGQDDDGTQVLELECEHISYRLNEVEYDLEYFTEIGTPLEVFTKVLENTPFTVGTIEFTDQVAYSLQETASRRFLLVDFANYLGGELSFNKFEVSILKRRGNYTPYTWDDCDVTWDEADFAWNDAKSIVPVSLTDGRNIEVVSKEIDKREVIDGEPLVVYACELINPTEISLGDEVTLNYPSLNIDTKLRVVSKNYDPSNDQRVSFEIGNYKPGLEDAARQIEVSALVKGKSYYGTRISPEYGFESIRSDKKARSVMNADTMAMYSGDGEGNYTPVFYFDELGNLRITTVEQELENIDGELEAHQATLEIHADAITSKVSSTNYNGETITSMINQTADTIKIEAVHLDLSGVVTATDLADEGATVINGKNITTGEIDAVDIVGCSVWDPTKETHITLGVGEVTIKDDTRDSGMIIDCKATGDVELKSVAANDAYSFLVSKDGYTYPTNVWNFSTATVTGLNITVSFG